MTLQIEILSTEMSDFLKQMVILKSFDSVFVLLQNVFFPSKTPKNIGPSYKVDLDFWDCLGRDKPAFYNQRDAIYFDVLTLKMPKNCSR